MEVRPVFYFKKKALKNYGAGELYHVVIMLKSYETINLPCKVRTAMHADNSGKYFVNENY